MLSLFQFVIVVPDYDSARSFFVDALGFDLVEDSDLGDGKRWIVVRPGPLGAAILLARAADERQRSRIGDQTGGRVGFFLATDDFAATHQRFVAHGVRFVEDPRIEPYGTVAVFEDCCGNRWDLIEPAASS